MIMNTDLIDHCVHVLRDYVANKKTETLRELAPLIVELRGRHSLRSGNPDWSGRTAEYRADMRWIYSEAGIPEDELDTVQAALRYHVGNLLRKRAPVSELEAAGLKATSPKERLEAIRRANARRSRCTCECTCGAKSTVETSALSS